MAKKSSKPTPTDRYRLEVVANESTVKKLTSIILGLDEIEKVKFRLNKTDIDWLPEDKTHRHEIKNIVLHPDGYELDNWLSGFLEAEKKIEKLLKAAKELDEVIKHAWDEPCFGSEGERKYRDFKDALEKVLKKR